MTEKDMISWTHKHCKFAAGMFGRVPEMRGNEFGEKVPRQGADALITSLANAVAEHVEKMVETNPSSIQRIGRPLIEQILDQVLNATGNTSLIGPSPQAKAGREEIITEVQPILQALRMHKSAPTINTGPQMNKPSPTI